MAGTRLAYVCIISPAMQTANKTVKNRRGPASSSRRWSCHRRQRLIGFRLGPARNVLFGLILTKRLNSLATAGHPVFGDTALGGLLFHQRQAIEPYIAPSFTIIMMCRARHDPTPLLPQASGGRLGGDRALQAGPRARGSPCSPLKKRELGYPSAGSQSG